MVDERPAQGTAAGDGPREGGDHEDEPANGDAGSYAGRMDGDAGQE